MNALTPLTSSSATGQAPHAPYAAPESVSARAGPAADEVVKVLHLPVEPLPALPAAVQRGQLDPAPSTLLSRQEMLYLLSLAI